MVHILFCFHAAVPSPGFHLFVLIFSGAVFLCDYIKDGTGQTAQTSGDLEISETYEDEQPNSVC